MAIEALFAGFIHLVQAAPFAAGLSFCAAVLTKFALGSVYIALLAFGVSFGILLAVL